MKKIITCLVAMMLFGATTAFAASATIYEKPNIKIIVGGKTAVINDVPIIVNGRTLIPLRELVTTLGVPNDEQHIIWEPTDRIVLVKYEDKIIDLQIDNKNAYLNNKLIILDSAPIIYKNRTYLPARFVGECLGYSIGWDQYTPAVTVNKEEVQTKINTILNDMQAKIAMQKQCVSQAVENTNINFGEYTVSARLIYLEKVDYTKQEVQTVATRSEEGDTNAIYKYANATKAYDAYAFYQNEDAAEDGWKGNGWVERNLSGDTSNQFLKVDKICDMKINKNLYNTLMVYDNGENYVIKTSSNQIGLLEELGMVGMDEYVNYFSTNPPKSFKYELQISKATKLPVGLSIELETVNKEVGGDIGEILSEKVDLTVSFDYERQPNISRP